MNSNIPYEKIYLRENSLIAFQAWDIHQTKPIQELWGMSYPPFIWDVYEGVASVYAKKGTFDWVQNVCAEKAQNPDFISEWLARHELSLKKLEMIWQNQNPLPTRESLLAFCDELIEGWVSLEVTYFAPMLAEGFITPEQRKACLHLRSRAIAFLDDSDRVILATLHASYPELGNLARFISLEELRTNQPFTREELEKRSQHLILYKGTIYTQMSLEAFLKAEGLSLKEEKPESRSKLKGQTAMAGKAAGRAHVLLKKSEVDQVKDGDILVSGMTVPDYVPAMKRAAAFVTDEGGVTCHAAIVAREFRKPCIIGTKFATELIKTGDWIEVDADEGVVKISKFSE